MYLKIPWLCFYCAALDILELVKLILQLSFVSIPYFHTNPVAHDECCRTRRKTLGGHIYGQLPSLLCQFMCLINHPCPGKTGKTTAKAGAFVTPHLSFSPFNQDRRGMRQVKYNYSLHMRNPLLGSVLDCALQFSLASCPH